MSDKTRPFTIFLLKIGFNKDNSLNADHGLIGGYAANRLPDGAVLHVLDAQPYSPWWKNYFDIQQDLKQASKGAIVFLPVATRCFALCFGHVSHKLKDTSFEYDFGLRVTLNCVDPKQLKNTDSLDPSESRRRRTQASTVEDLTFFDLDTDSTIIKSLTGKVRTEFKHYFKSATGSSSIHVSTKSKPEELVNLCTRLLDLYNNETYRTTFPGIQNISPIRDPTLTEKLNTRLIAALQSKDEALALSIPEMLDYTAGLHGVFSGAGKPQVYDEIFIGNYFTYLENAAVSLDTIGIEQLKKHQLGLCNSEGQDITQSFPVLRCLVFDTTLDGISQAFHLMEGNWYAVETNYIKRLTDYLDPLCKDTTLCDYHHGDEGKYNIAASANDNRICLDETNLSLEGQTKTEPCDIAEISSDELLLHHVKISTLSAKLSHLFNQGTNSIRLLRDDNDAIERLKSLIDIRAKQFEKSSFSQSISKDKIRIIFGIITHKEKSKKSLNLPLFSRISLWRCMKELKRMNVSAEYNYIKDVTKLSAGKPKVRGKKPPVAGQT